MDAAEITPKISVGGWGAAKEKSQDFDCVVNCATDAPHTSGAHFHLVDGPGNNPLEMQKAADEVCRAIKANQKILIHCLAGYSRSVVVTALGMHKAGIGNFDDNLAKIMSLRNCQPTRPFRPAAELVEMAKQLCH